MAFHVGQRVRVISVEFRSLPWDADLVGREGVVTGYDAHYSNRGVALPWTVEVDGKGECGFCAHNLAPLTDPNAERFIESLKKLAREPLPLTKEKTV